jgi:hypothetical protein
MPNWFDDWQKAEKSFERLKSTAAVYHRFEDCGGNINYVKCYEIKTTAKGVWVKRSSWDRPHWFNQESRKRYAYERIEDAWESFTRRKAKQHIYLSREYGNCCRVLESINSIDGDIGKVVTAPNGYCSHSIVVDDLSELLDQLEENKDQ